MPLPAVSLITFTIPSVMSHEHECRKSQGPMQYFMGHWGVASVSGPGLNRIKPIDCEFMCI